MLMSVHFKAPLWVCIVTLKLPEGLLFVISMSQVYKGKSLPHCLRVLNKPIITQSVCETCYYSQTWKWPCPCELETIKLLKNLRSCCAALFYRPQNWMELENPNFLCPLFSKWSIVTIVTLAQTDVLSGKNYIVCHRHVPTTRTLANL